MQQSEIELLSAKQTAAILGCSPGTIYNLWREGLLDYWNIHGTMKTNLMAIAEFLEKTKNVELNEALGGA